MLAQPGGWGREACGSPPPWGCELVWRTKGDNYNPASHVRVSYSTELLMAGQLPVFVVHARTHARLVNLGTMERCPWFSRNFPVILPPTAGSGRFETTRGRSKSKSRRKVRLGGGNGIVSSERRWKKRGFSEHFGISVQSRFNACPWLAIRIFSSTAIDCTCDWNL